MEELTGRVAVVTGGASGIGRGMVDAFVAQGMKIVIGDVEQGALDSAVSELKNGGADVVGVICDVSKQESVDALAKATLDAFGAAHVLCNNAGVAGSSTGQSWNRPIEDWNWVMGVNMNGVLHGIRSFVPIMLEQGDEAHIVNTASIAGLVGGGGAYGVSKSACVAISESLFGELALAGPKLGVSVLCPGWVRTRILESERNRPEEPREVSEETTPLVAMMREAAKNAVEKGLDPREVGDIVVDAIKSRRFYVLTHQWQDMIAHHHANIIEGRDPVGMMPPGVELPGQ
ncbi:MAG: NAD(P)-dependent dehydrogenase (short-subunit alcohol dehydrogenase family) [Myxococcota bacterium]|jgi:NAD(P)-dependent dehydrogenase (short-subunit alcohol dehydrogenase family)